jgi:hypothetical protein
MASYTTNLKTWGANGAEYPDGYNYVEGEQPVDEWDNFLTNQIVNDIKDHLIPLTNSRVESEYGAAGGEPESPETSHFYHDQDNERLELYDATANTWRDIMFRDGDTMTGALDMGNYPVQNHTDLVDNNGNVVWDYSAGHIPQGRLQNDNITVSAGTGLNGGGSVALGGTVNVDVDDSRYVLESGDRMGGNLDFGGNQATGLDRTQFNNIETVADAELGMDDSMGFIGNWGGNGMAVLWDSYNVSAGTHINVNGGKGDESQPTISHASTSSQGDVTTGGATVVDDIYVDGNGHVTNLNTQNRSLDDWDAPSSTVYFDREGIQSNSDWIEIDGNGKGILMNYKNQGEETRFYGPVNIHNGISGINLGDLDDVSASGEGSGNNFDADTVDGQHASEIGSKPAIVYDLTPNDVVYRDNYHSSYNNNYSGTTGRDRDNEWHVFGSLNMDFSKKQFLKWLSKIDTGGSQAGLQLRHVSSGDLIYEMSHPGYNNVKEIKIDIKNSDRSGEFEFWIETELGDDFTSYRQEFYSEMREDELP